MLHKMNKKPFLIMIDGPIGSGKSTTAKILHSKMKRTALIALDRIKHLLYDYRVDNHADLQLASDVGAAMTKTYLSRGINVIVEKAFTQDKYLRSFAKIARGRARLLIYQIEAPVYIRIQRVKQRPLPPDAKGKPKLEKIKRNTLHYEQFKYKGAKVFDSSLLSPNQIVRRILKDV